jgi:hypothetical protein
LFGLIGCLFGLCRHLLGSRNIGLRLLGSAIRFFRDLRHLPRELTRFFHNILDHI